MPYLFFYFFSVNLLTRFSYRVIFIYVVDEGTDRRNNKSKKEILKLIKSQTFFVGSIGHKADQLQALFSEYTTEPNDHGHFLRFENTSHMGNEGVICVTTVFEDETHFTEMLHTRLLFNL